MKTAISLPDRVYEAVEKAAKKHGMSRSEFYAKAAAQYVEQLRAEDVTRNLNEVYQSSPAELDEVLIALQNVSFDLDPEKPW